MVSGILLLYTRPLCSQLKAQRWHRLLAHDSQQSTHLLHRVQLVTHSLSPSLWESHTLLQISYFFLQNCVFLDSGTNCTVTGRVMYLLFTAVCKIQISFSLNVKLSKVMLICSKCQANSAWNIRKCTKLQREK